MGCEARRKRRGDSSSGKRSSSWWTSKEKVECVYRRYHERMALSGGEDRKGRVHRRAYVQTRDCSGEGESRRRGKGGYGGSLELSRC